MGCFNIDIQLEVNMQVSITGVTNLDNSLKVFRVIIVEDGHCTVGDYIYRRVSDVLRRIRRDRVQP